LWDLIRLRHEAHDDTRAQTLAVLAAERGDSGALKYLAELYERARSPARARAIRQLAADRGEVWALPVEARDAPGHHGDHRIRAATLKRAGDTAGARTLYQQAVELGDVGALFDLVTLLEETGDGVNAEKSAMQAANLGDPSALVSLIRWREGAGDVKGVQTLYRHVVDNGARWASADFARLQGQTIATTGRPTNDASDGTPRITDRLGTLVSLLEEAGESAAAKNLALRIADHGNLRTLLDLLALRKNSGNLAEARVLAVELANYGKADPLWDLLELPHDAGADLDADRIRRFGLTGAGEIATTLEF
jgi:TPR repeat protein